MMKIGTSGFRGTISDDFTKENITKITQTICNIIIKQNYKKRVVVGYDNRFMGEMFAQWISEVFAGNNIEVYLTNTSVPSPLVSFATKKLNNDFGIMITASHNPYFYNGIKVFSKDGKEPEEWLEKILNKKPEKIKKVKFLEFEQAKELNLIKTFNFDKEYVKNIVSLLKFKKFFDVKTAFNVMNGSSANVILELKKQLKLENLDIYNTERDALFNMGGPIPSEENLQDYIKIAVKNKYNFAFATDGDGDRVSVIDEKGVFHNCNEVASLLYFFAIKEKGLKGGIVKNYSFSTLIDNLAKKLGTEVFETKVGFKNITRELIKNDALMGAENSGCEVKNHVYIKDGLLVYALLLEVVQYYKKPLGKIFKQLKEIAEYNMEYKEYSFKVKNKEAIINYLQNNQPNFSKKVVKKGTLDGFKYIFEDNSWILIRFSGTENLLRLVVEQPNLEDLENILNQAIEFANAF